ncbi:hypothetical protein [Desulfobaculum bizertense]|uniref:Uncharacterized protein n=1 Tax=Desulfobaculum bizertense DSM 18034 TaxID=1121442 RepID=A0A1T4VGQ0_9BACT|nr:hypothetical protein [Desulfobaculum bizertense]UIJ37802.1 hypothetical protein LWC08_14080 [Desulfobaculum bizertense]SKA64142.1 hypothetical protein SAMN02745702_00274 [Desulfobaculum bizertense DSM 18034]
MSISDMQERELAHAVSHALATPDGKILREFLQTHCFMQPTLCPETWQSAEQVSFRYGRMTLFQLLERLEQIHTEQHKQHKEQQDHDNGSLDSPR